MVNVGTHMSLKVPFLVEKFYTYCTFVLCIMVVLLSCMPKQATVCLKLFPTAVAYHLFNTRCILVTVFMHLKVPSKIEKAICGKFTYGIFVPLSSFPGFRTWRFLKRFLQTFNRVGFIHPETKKKYIYIYSIYYIQCSKVNVYRLSTYTSHVRGMFEMNCLLSSSSISTWGTIKTNTYLYRVILYLHNGV